MKFEVSDSVKGKKCLFSFLHKWKTHKRKIGYFRYTKEIQNITKYQECIICFTRRIKYKGDWKDLNIFDTSYFITENYNEWLASFALRKGKSKNERDEGLQGF